MQSTHDLAVNIVWKCNNLTGGTNEDMVNAISNSIAWHIDDALKVVKNINETSVNKQDRVDRLIELEQKFGIPKTHLL